MKNKVSEFKGSRVQGSTLKPLNSSTFKPLKDGWKWVRLGEVCEICQYGLTATSTDKGSFAYIRITDIDDFGNIKVDTLKFINCDEKTYEKYELKEGDILFARSGSIGRTFLYSGIPPKAVFASYLIRFRLKDEIIDPIWLFHYTHSAQYYEFVEAKKHTLSQPNINAQEYKSLLIPLPPLLEQRHIAAKLKALMEEVERARTACEKQLEAAKALPSAYLREVFESEEAKKWERRRLGEVCEVFSGSSAPQDKKYFENGKYPFVRVQDLGRYGRTDNLVDIKDYVNDIAIGELKLKKAQKGTILFPKSGAAITTNSRAILGTDAYIVSHLAAVKPKDEVADTYFVYYWLCLTDMIQYMGNPGYPSLKLSTISKITIPLPTLYIQHRIASELKEKMAQAEKLRTSIEKQLEAINALSQAILRKAFRGEL